MIAGKSLQEYDKSSKWLVQHHGDSILRLAGISDIAWWKPLQAEIVQSRRLPDGLIEAACQGQKQPSLFILEIATYPDARVIQQVCRDVALVYLDRDVLPEVLVLFLHPKGNMEPAASAALSSPQGWTNWNLSWRAVELWKVPADELLAAGDVGFDPLGAPGSVRRTARAGLSPVPRLASSEMLRADEQENLLAVTQLLAGLRYNDPKLFQLFGGLQAMIESPVLQELKAEWTREGAIEATCKAIVKLVVLRFGVAAETIGEQLRAVEDEDRLSELFEHAATCSDLESFQKKLSR